jgi:hypothetical protein
MNRRLPYMVCTADRRMVGEYATHRQALDAATLLNRAAPACPPTFRVARKVT